MMGNMAIFECDKCGKMMERGSDHSKGARSPRCACGGRMLRKPEGTPNEMRDMDNELGRDE